MTLQGVSSWMQVVRFQHKQLYSRGLSKYFRCAVARLSAGGEIWALMSVVAVVNLFLHFVLERTVNIFIQKVTRQYRRELFKNTMKQEVAFFNPDHNAIGAICSRLLTNAFNLNELLGINFAPILTNIITFTCVSILGIAYGWRLGLVCVFAALPPILLSDYFCILLGN
ncbi:ABC transporter type 1, transmembrane domain-containing protein [Aspergillus leporis]|uniref:ABC transporter type 1, transmembrane domain-containing protein n=1 Tax=Aspergillus leporis TaxID=41062 RepID=A0A5N5WJS9_9EURO|nr:ABC transporter type 1, transmembrane domain-containing protein [Aspergillus leporis]